MRLLVNTATTFKGGGVQVAASFLREICRFDDHQFGVILGPGLSGLVRPNAFPKNFEFFQIDYRPAQLVFSVRSSGRDLEEIESNFRPDVVFTTSGPSYWRPTAPHLMGFNLPHHVYSESPYFSSVLSAGQRLRWRAKSKLIRHYTRRFADAWVVQTDDVNSRLRRWIDSDQVFTVTNTVSKVFEPEKCVGDSESFSSTHPGSEFRLLVLSSYYRHKNLEILNSIIELMRKRDIEGVRFTMTLPVHDFENTIEPENRSWIDNLGPVTPDECPNLYRNTDALFLPSLLECFSANYVEAMAMRRPIITTDLGFSRTICADAALYFEPLNGAGALQKILQLKADRKLRDKLVERGQNELHRFGTARERAEAYLQLCQKLVGNRLAH